MCKNLYPHHHSFKLPKKYDFNVEQFIYHRVQNWQNRDKIFCGYRCDIQILKITIINDSKKTDAQT